MNREKDEILLGYIKGKVESIDANLGIVCKTVEENVRVVVASDVRITAIEELVSKHQEKISKHDIVFGKIGTGAALLIFIISISINFIIDLIRSKWFN